MEIGDHGSIIVAAEMDKPVNEVMYVELLPSHDPLFLTLSPSYTITDGDEWLSCSLGTIPITVANIRVDVGWDSRQFIVYGTRVINGDPQVVVIHLNFEKTYKRKCNATTLILPLLPSPRSITDFV